MTNKDFVEKLVDIAKNYKTLYVMGCIGAPMTKKNKERYSSNYEYNKKPERTAMINAATADTFGFDCVCLLKSVLWGWNGDKNATYGGAAYLSCGVPDIGTESIIGVCEDVSTKFDTIEIGELVWMEGHVGVYIGDGLCVECTPKWSNDVQITACGNIGSKKGYNTRTWKKHGKLPYVEYIKEEEKAPEEITAGSVVTFKENAETYFPNSARIPKWVKEDYRHTVTKTQVGGKDIVKGGKKCVLLGKKINKKSGIETDGINTWTAIENLEVVKSEPTENTYTVKEGDTLWSIAKEQLGAGSRYSEIVILNGLKTATIYAGQKIVMPRK